MPWKVGGNFETVAVTCETNWKECVIAVANYLWSEVVSDVVDYLAKEGIIWVLAIAITAMMLIRTKYWKNTEHAVFNKRILNKVGYKIQDLELKINVLTYKMQYGTWPLPHQICNLNPKLRKIRMTLSNPGDRKNWLKHVLLNSSLENNVYAPYSKASHSSIAKLPNHFDTKQERIPHVKHSELSTACSSIDTLKSTSDQSVNMYSWRPGTHLQNADTKKNLSKSKDFTLQRQNMQLLPLDSNIINHKSSKMTPLLTQNGACATNAKYNPCQEFTDTIYKCKSFLKELHRNDKCLPSLDRSSKMSKVSSLKAAHEAKQTALSTTIEREASCDAPTAAKGEDKKYAERIKDDVVKTEETYRQSKVNVSNDAVVSKIHNCASSRKLVQIMQPTRNVQPSQETLHEVRRRLRSLHNMLQTYQDTSRSPEKQESMDRIDKIESFITYPVVNISSEYFDLDRSEESLSSLAEYSSRTSKTYRRSSENVTLQDTCSKGFRRRSVRSDLPAIATTESHLHSRNAMLQTSENNEDEYKGSACDFDILNRSYNHESNLQTDKDTMKTDANTLINIQNNISEAVSEKIFYILSPENKDIETQNETSLKTRFDKFSNAFDKEYDCEYQENMTMSQNSSQSKISKEDKSTALLLQEALHFKNVLLTHSKKKYPTNDMKQSDVADKFSPGLNNNFPSMIIDVKDEEPVISHSHDKINQRYICLEMKQRRDLFPQSSKKANTFAHKDERDTESQNCIPETSSEYFSITNLAMQNSAKIENNVSLKPPVYEKVISIAIPIDKVNVESPDKINTNESPMKTKTVLRNIQTHVNLRENLRESAASDIDDIIANKRSPRILKLEDLILERVKNIRDYMDTFLQSQNTAIFKARRALQCQDKSDTFRCSDEASHVVVYNRSTAPSSCNSTDKISSKKSLDFLTDTWPNYIQKYKQEMDDVLNCSSDVYLKRNPGMFALTPIKNKFTNKNDAQQSEVVTELEEKDLSLPKALAHSCKNYSKSTHRITNLIMPRCEKHIASNIENGKIDKGTTVDVNDDADFHKRRRQMQIAESKPSTISYFPLDVSADAKIIHVARKEYLTKSNCNSISHSNSYFTDEEIISDVRMDDVSSESTSNVKHSHAKSNVQKEIKQNVIKRQISVDECPNTNVAMPSKLSSDNEYSNLTIIIDSNLILDKSGCNHLTKAKTASPLTMLKENNFIFDPETSIPLSLEKEDKILNTGGITVNNLKQNDEISVNTVHSPRGERYSIKPFQTSKIKAKSDMSLITNRSKNLKINLVPKKSHSFLMRHNTMEFISGILHQPCAKLHNDKNKCIKNKLRLTTQSKSVISPRRISTKSCIPILKNCVESSHRMKHQAQTRSPMKSPLTMLWREKTCTKDHATDEEVARSNNGSINKHLRVEEAVSDLKELNTEKGILNKELEKSNVACRNISKKNSGIMFSENVKSLAIDKEHSDEKDTCDKHKSDTSIIQHIEKIASKEVVVISIMANDSLRKKYPADLFILNSKNISPAADLLIHKNKLWTITVGKTEKEVTAKPSITDTCTSMPDLQ